MLSHRAVIATALLFAAGCGARTNLGENEEMDASLAQDASEDVHVWDSTVQDSTVDVQNDVIVDDVIALDVIEIDAGPQCIADCTHNFQCEQTCPTLQTGRWCCDEQIGTCYAFAGKHCPAQIFDAGFD